MQNEHRSKFLAMCVCVFVHQVLSVYFSETKHYYEGLYRKAVVQRLLGGNVSITQKYRSLAERSILDLSIHLSTFESMKTRVYGFLGRK